jgi:hypothetical protein
MPWGEKHGAPPREENADKKDDRCFFIDIFYGNFNSDHSSI